MTYNPYFDPTPQMQRGNQLPMMMGGGLGGLGAIPMGPMPAPAAAQHPASAGQVLQQGAQNYLSSGGQQGTPPGPGQNFMAQLLQKRNVAPGDQWNTQTIPAGSAHDWLNWVFNR